MKCSNCNHTIPDDSEFCSFCGSKLSSAKHDNSDHKSEGIPAQSSGKAILQPRKTKLPVIIAAVLGVLLIGSAIWNTLQASKVAELTSDYNTALAQAQEDSQTITTLQKNLSSQQKDIEQLNDEISSLEKEISQLTNTNNAYKTSSNAFSQIRNAAIGSSIGYASSNFHVNTGVVTVNKGQSKTISLVANWSSGGTVSIARDNSNAALDITDSSWYTSTTVKITGYSKGVTIATFSSTAESKTFKVIVIVT